MATALLGDQIDIHCGGVDNIFPHHEAEIAQSEGVTGKQFVRVWLHCAHLLVDGQKMSKSLGNFYTIPDVLGKGYTGREIRYALIRVNYRTQLNFTWDGMKEARESLGRIDDWLERLREVAGDKKGNTKIEMQFGHEFEDALDAMDESKLDGKTAAGWLSWWNRINQVLDFESDGAELPEEVAKLAEARAQARLAKDFRKSDELRDKLNALGWEARDTKDGQKITRRAGA
jgi:cysteinyl-tRNA synthetase